ncbi:MAG: 4-hydroxyphenylacetate 3-hydroxylase [Candidatus Lambdaproteobacteria bacterium]|nr:4-hydroxyphenylacetate 3-hydroxylase [Candidatus Lambdaproteobacteria bacterium]
MGMKTPEQYIASLRDGRELFMDGRKIADVTRDPSFRVAIETAARDYDYVNPAHRAIRTYTMENGELGNRLFQIPRNAEELQARVALLRSVSILSATASSLFALLHVKDEIGAVNAQYAKNIERLYQHCRDNDLRIAEVITDAKGDRSRHPAKQDDPDLYLRVVARKPDGIVVRGAKLHITGAALVHELIVLPTKAMGLEEVDYAVAFSVPPATKGVKIVNRSYAHGEMSTFDYPVSGHHNMPEGFVIFDDVFVPWERVFLCGEYQLAGTFAHALGLWERVGSLIFAADRARLMVGAAQLIAEYNGIDKASHVVDKITELIFYAEILRMSLDTAIREYETAPSGMVYPNALAVNVGKYHAASNYHSMVRPLHDISGGLVVTLPVEADYRNPELTPYFEKYLHTKPGVAVEDRMKLYNLIRDISADAYGGWELVTTLQAGGGLTAQKIVSYRTYDLAGAKQEALRAAGIARPAAPQAAAARRA